MMMFLQVALGLLVGVLAAVGHLTLAWKAAQQTVESGRGTPALLGMPVRVAAVGLPLAALALVGTASLVAGLVGFAVSHQTLRARWTREDAP